MTRTIINRHSSHCPYVNQIQTVDITYAEIRSIGRMSPGYKITSFYCPHGAECPYPSQSRSGVCPVVESAPEQPY